jgi:APA family basic amino acid/polyamine antiporter
MSKKTIGLFTAGSIVIANMIGTGVFTSLGFQCSNIQSVFSLLMLWLIGGLVALCGALSYSELAAAMPRSGGEYHYLSKIYHPSLGFVSGFVSLIVGFAAPISLASMAFGTYFNSCFSIGHPSLVGISAIVILSILHSIDIGLASKFQNIFTSLKIILILAFILMGFFIDSPQNIEVFPKESLIPSESWKSIFSPAFAISLIFVSYAYSGWNASTYLAGEIDRPHRNLPISIIAGTLIVSVLYLVLNYIFLYTVPIGELKDQLEIGFISAEKILGPSGGRMMGGMISLLLVSSISSMIFAGPRITQTMGEDISILSFIAKKNKKGIPAYSIFLQSGIAILLLLTSSFEKVLTYVGFLLTIFTILTVAGVYVLRITKPDMPRPYRTWGYPVVPALFIALNIWILVYVVISRPEETLAGLSTILLGLIFYVFEKLKKK